MPKPVLTDCGGIGQPPCPPVPAAEPIKQHPVHPAGDDGPELDENLAEYLKKQGKE